mmetsp:Transcript_22030/g.49181  ORF Transcript_22030/g.49181 Transcript_22030/m.49181 type:complete len:297 (-) Transcript_22030:2277-3167(-)
MKPYLLLLCVFATLGSDNANAQLQRRKQPASYLRNKKTLSQRGRKHNLDPTPPGYEDSIWCPPGTCDMKVTHDMGQAGPSRFFHECYSRKLGAFVQEAWTGSLADNDPPPEWISEPRLKQCPGSVHWSDIIKDDNAFGTFRIASDTTSSGNPRRSAKGKWCWDVKGGVTPGNKIVLKRCNDKTKQLFVMKIAPISSNRSYQELTIHPKRKKSLCVGVASTKGKSWLRLERCIDNDASQRFRQYLGKNLCGQFAMSGDDLVVTNQGIKPMKGAAVMLSDSDRLRSFRDSIATWCPQK